MLDSLSPHFDYLVFATVTCAVFVLLHGRCWRGRRLGSLPSLTWLLVAGILAGGWFLAEDSAHREIERRQQVAQGYAPTYAEEMGLMGHQEITVDTSADDPRYWRMISAEKRWLTANPAINDIYTLRKLANGRVVRIVDSETDFDHNGRIEGERELRKPIGQAYEGSLGEVMGSVLAGRPYFQDVPTTDHWGARASAVVPIRNFRGDAEGALVVEFDAQPWLAAARISRLTTMAYLAAVLLTIAVAGGLLARPAAIREVPTAVPTAEPTAPVAMAAATEPAAPAAMAVQPAPAPPLNPVQAEMHLEKQRLETLVNSIDGIVWEADARTLAFTFVSQQCEAMLGYPQKDWMTVVELWKTKTHPEDQWVHEHRARTVATKEPYSCEYRMTADDGRIVWIRESAAVILDSAGAPLFVRGIFHDVTAQKRAAEELEEANARLVDSSRYAGMAEVATGVLHNVGNVLNSVNISGSVISERLKKSKVIELGKVAGLLTLQKEDFAGFVARDPRGPHIPELISCLAEALRGEHGELLEEVDSITRNISHIKEIVSMQQGFAKGAGIVQALCVQTLVDDAIKINAIHLSRHQINVVQAYEDVPNVLADKHLVLQILVNLLRNAQQAIEGSAGHERRIVVKIQGSRSGFVQVTVQDSGGGIAAENLTRIFSHGFTTKKTGHGFGLHSSALAATGMGGTLAAHSEGLGTGATFSLELPIFQSALIASAA